MAKRALLATLVGISAVWTAAASAADIVPIDADDVGGVVTSAKGPEAGVWVIAETADLATPTIKIVVTDDAGRYVVPDLPKAKYKLWVRGYGLTDSKPVAAAPGQHVNLTAMTAPSPAAAAEIYPANYWFSLLRPPAADQFPGTGTQGNGLSPQQRSPNDWLVEMKEGCLPCHQLGTRNTRELEAANTLDAWDKRIQMLRPDSDVTLGRNARAVQQQMTNTMTHLGRAGSIKVFADWTDRIAKGELPAEAPARPAGIERNVVVTISDWGQGLFVHSTASTDRRKPTVNANGPVYGGSVYGGSLLTYDPKSHQAINLKVPKSQPPRQFDAEPAIHNPMIDGKGRVWITEIPSATGKPHPAFCSDGKLSRYAAYYPLTGEPKGHEVVRYDPATKEFELIDYCVNSQIAAFQHDADNTVVFSGMNSVLTWINTRVWDETHDGAKAFGWCPIVVDTNGDGKITPDRNQWNVLAGGVDGGGAMGEGVTTKVDHGRGAFDPKHDTQVTGYWYGMGVSPVDDSAWAIKFTPFLQTGIVHLTMGKHPPETCQGEYFEPPKRADGLYSAYNARGVEVDGKGVVWVAFGSGQIGRFDRSQCKVLNGPTATGQHCPEGWTILDVPGPKMGPVGTAEWLYMAWVDLYDAGGLGRDVPIMTGTQSDALIAVLPGNKLVQLRVPYPQSMFTRYVDARIDDPAAGWKGKGLWTAYEQVPQWHIEGGEGTTSKAVKFQVRPDPLAH